jgi:hypothetical protein
MPKGNRIYWKRKIASNKARDRLVNQRLLKLGWQVLRIWEHELAKKDEARLVKRIQRALYVTSDKWQALVKVLRSSACVARQSAASARRRLRSFAANDAVVLLNRQFALPKKNQTISKNG